MPPSAHCTFANEGFVICSFVPRPLEEDPAVLKVPFYHANIDADEVLFYHSGDYFSRAGIDVGFMTLHPQGVHHGPQPAAIEASKTKTRTDEVAVMVETRESARAVARGRGRRHHRVRDLVGPRHGAARLVREALPIHIAARGLPAAPRRSGRREPPRRPARRLERGIRGPGSIGRSPVSSCPTLSLIEEGPEVWARGRVRSPKPPRGSADVRGSDRRRRREVALSLSIGSRRCATSSRSRIT